MKRNEYDMFPQLKAYPSEKNLNTKEIITGHLEQLTKNLVQYYDVAIMPTNKKDWMIDPFAVTSFSELLLNVVKELMDMTAEASNRLSFESFKKKHPTLSVNIYFWVSICTVYPVLSKFVIKQLIPFATTHLCEAGFSAISVLKTKKRNRLDVEDDIWSCLCNVTPRFLKLTENMPAQCSY